MLLSTKALYNYGVDLKYSPVQCLLVNAITLDDYATLKERTEYASQMMLHGDCNKFLNF